MTTTSQQKMHKTLYTLKMQISKKPGCNDIFKTVCQLQSLINQVSKQRQYAQKYQQQITKSYQNQSQGLQSHINIKQKSLQQQIKYLKSENSRLQNLILQSAMNKIQLQTSLIQNKYDNKYQNDEVYKMLKQQINKWKQQAYAKDVIIKKLRNSDAYTITYKSSNSNSTGVSSGSGQKLSGHDFKKRDMYGEDRSGDFDDL